MGVSWWKNHKELEEQINPTLNSHFSVSKSNKSQSVHVDEYSWDDQDDQDDTDQELYDITQNLEGNLEMLGNEGDIDESNSNDQMYEQVKSNTDNGDKLNTNNEIYDSVQATN